MRAAFGVLAFASAVASSAIKGYNTGSTHTGGRPKTEADFTREFQLASKVTAGFNSARLYTTVQAGSTSDVISAIPAAIKTKTSLLLGLWTSAGPDSFNNEINALKQAIQTYGQQLADITDAIVVGSEDLYRISPIGVVAGSNQGEKPEVIVDYIQKTRAAIAGTPLEKKPVSHADTWTAWVDPANKVVVDASDIIVFHGYPYYEKENDNTAENGAALIKASLEHTRAAVGSKEIWVGETGWPLSGKTVGKAVASSDNAKKFWDQAGCNLLFDKINTWWFELTEDSLTDPSFAILGTGETPLFDTSCSGSNGTQSVPANPGNPPSSAPGPSGGAGGGGSGGNGGSGTGGASAGSGGPGSSSPGSGGPATSPPSSGGAANSPPSSSPASGGSATSPPSSGGAANSPPSSSPSSGGPATSPPSSGGAANSPPSSSPGNGGPATSPPSSGGTGNSPSGGGGSSGNGTSPGSGSSGGNGGSGSKGGSGGGGAPTTTGSTPKPTVAPGAASTLHATASGTAVAVVLMGMLAL